ncbi:hypothetical protein MAPG_00394 [Magnaporthiopsis poae ATCC 64411]|uniref:Uncharacterized protein n=1 Tax=Magnaporthiopsis poae (strain ATCC 64411 / 73-15) TaxID=644358 RepID=A0A0C4DKW2_MAGP6|nr:hypothetical protein MAPG_00394 [Magnaporthiopsis poae ATCC 64411]
MAIKGYTFVRRKWRSRKPLWFLMILQLAHLIPLLVLFGIAQPDVFRTLMWRIGYAEKLNSNPNTILYAYANFEPLPRIPFRWSQELTEFNVAISVISLFYLLVMLILTIMKVYYPIVGVVTSTIMVALYTTSVYGQAGPDYLDPRYPSPIPWYLTKSCDVAERYKAGKTCQIVKGTFAVSVTMLAVYTTLLGFSIYNMIPLKSDANMVDEDEENNSRSSSPHESKETWEMQPQTPRGVPFTPRTQAFHTLDRKLPFRQYA